MQTSFSRISAVFCSKRLLHWAAMARSEGDEANQARQPKTSCDTCHKSLAPTPSSMREETSQNFVIRMTAAAYTVSAPPLTALPPLCTAFLCHVVSAATSSCTL